MAAKSDSGTAKPESGPVRPESETANAVGGNGGGVAGVADTTSGNGGNAGEPQTASADPADAPVRKRRGRPPKNPNALPGTGTAASADAKAGAKIHLGTSKGEKPPRKKANNDAAVIAQNLSAVHAVWATVATLPVVGMPPEMAANLALKPEEASKAGKDLKSILDEIGVDVTSGEMGVIGKAITAVVTMASIEYPRLMFFALWMRSQRVKPVMPSTPAEAAMSTTRGGGIDLSGLEPTTH